MFFLLQTVPDLPGSALRWCTAPSPGVNTPMLYIGMLFATFSWHVEDHFMYSINYSHAGSSKVWYCVPASGADALEAAATETIYRDPCATMAQEGASPEVQAAAAAEARAAGLAGSRHRMVPRAATRSSDPPRAKQHTL